MAKGLAVFAGRKRLIAAIFFALCSVITYCSSSEYNIITDEKQYVSLSVEEEIALGLQSAPQMAAQYGGALQDADAQALIDRVGEKIVSQTAAGETPYEFEFTVLANDNVINAFALPGGPIFITTGLLNGLETEAQLAGVLAHEIGHVVARHAAEQIAKAQLTEGLTGAAAVAAYDPENPNSSQQTAALTALIGEVVNMKYGRDDELESDRLGVRFMANAGYDPRAMIRVMEVLAEAGRGPQPPEFFSTHPNPDNRIERIQAAIAEEFPEGVPEELRD